MCKTINFYEYDRTVKEGTCIIGSEEDKVEYTEF